ncbi:MAG: hypothetical protein BroJett029_19410 [Alphaproteobacteria bacterium]|nr:MAG: hypothetical protein BroJett029_19410 [Alphaproteobacteria bacterium]
MSERKTDRPGTVMQTDVMPRKSGGRLGREVQTKIGQQLRAMYDDVVKQGVPDRFTDLLKQLDKGEGQDKRHDDNRDEKGSSE